MKPIEFQSAYSGDLKKFFESNMGREFITLVNGLRPPLPQSFPTEHAMIRAYANAEGYETCLRTMVSLAMPPKVTPEPEITYGVSDPKVVQGKTETK